MTHHVRLAPPRSSLSSEAAVKRVAAGGASPLIRPLSLSKCPSTGGQVCQPVEGRFDKLSGRRSGDAPPAAVRLTAASPDKRGRGAGQPDVVRHLWARIRLAGRVRPTA